MKNKFSCSEPQNNMYISREGWVKICCHNNYFEIGNLKINTLLEIWNSDKRKKFAQLLYKNSNEQSCANCTLKQPDRKNYPLFNKSFKASDYPKSIEFELSNKCNLECIMCSPLLSNQIAKRYNEYQESLLNYQIDLEQLDPFLPYLKEAKFYGGEPFIIEQYFDIWKYIISKNPNCKFYIQTNGTILNEKIKTILNKGNFNIGVSVESVNQETYNKVRVNSDLQKVLSNINYFHQYSKQKNNFFGIAVCPIRDNWSEIPHLVEYFNNLEIPVNFHTVVQPFNVSLWNLEKEKLYEIHKSLSEFKFKVTNNQTSILNIKTFKSLVFQISEWYNTSVEREKESEKFINMSISELINNINNKLKLFIDNLSWMEIKIKERKIKLFSEKLNNACDSITDKSLLKSKLIKLQNTPVYILAGEIERISILEIKKNLLSL